jgi:hypothetical protein
LDFFDQIGELLSQLGAEIAQLLAQVLEVFLAVAQFIWDILTQVAQYLVDGFKAVGDFFSHLWNDFFKGIFTDIFDAVRKFGQWVAAKLKPIIDFLKHTLKYVDKIYKTYVRPVLRAIQAIRKVISLLRLLHIHVFDGLDKILGQVQRDINAVFTQIRGILNSAIDLLNVISDPSKLLRHPTLILSIRRSAMALVRNTTGLPPGFFFPGTSTAPRGITVPKLTTLATPQDISSGGGLLDFGPVPFNFDPNDPLQNPPPSSYLDADVGVPDFSDLGDGETIGDSSIDDMAALAYFDGLYNFDDDGGAGGSQLDAVTQLFIAQAKANG